MLTAIILTASIVIAVGIYSLCKSSGEWSRIEESTEWARKWNQQWSCDNKCKECDERQGCPFNEVKE